MSLAAFTLRSVFPGRALLRFAGLLLALTSATPAMAEVYRWVDDSGQVHYGDQPPPEAEPVPLPASGRTTAPQAEAATSSDEGAGRSECEAARKQLAEYEGADRISETNALGETRDYGPEEIAELIARQKAEVASACGSPD